MTKASRHKMNVLRLHFENSEQRILLYYRCFVFFVTNQRSSSSEIDSAFLLKSLWYWRILSLLSYNSNVMLAKRWRISSDQHVLKSDFLWVISSLLFVWLIFCSLLIVLRDLLRFSQLIRTIRRHYENDIRDRRKKSFLWRCWHDY